MTTSNPNTSIERVSPIGARLPMVQPVGTTKWLIFGFSAFVLASFYVLLAESGNFDLGVFRGMFVPDTVNIARTFDDLSTMSGGVPFEPGMIGVSLLFGWVWILDPALCIFVNLALVLATGIVVSGIAQRVSAPGWAVLGVFINPYLLLAAVAPNKEIPLIFLGSLWALIILSKPAGWQAGALFTAFCVYLFRDGFGASLAITTLFVAMFGIRSKLLTAGYFLLTVSIAGGFGLLIRIIPILQRNYDAFRQDYDAGAAVGNLAAAFNLDSLTFTGGIVMLFLRMIYNALTLPIFPILTTEYGYGFWLGYSYWIFGILNLMLLMGSIYALTRKAGYGWEGREFLAALVCVTWFSISLSQFVQPRYFMPVLPLGFCLFATLPIVVRKRLGMAAITLVVAVIGLYTVAGQSPRPAAIPLHEVPSFLWTSL